MRVGPAWSKSFETSVLKSRGAGKELGESRHFKATVGDNGIPDWSAILVYSVGKELSFCGWVVELTSDF